MSTLVVTLETVGEEWEKLDARTKRDLTAWIDRTAFDDRTALKMRERVVERLPYSPLTAQVLVLALFDLERQETAVYYRGSGAAPDLVVDGVRRKERTEATLLREWWRGAASYDTIVTFDGRRFVAPFLHHRSAAYGIKPSLDLLSERYVKRQKEVQHIDLLDQLTFYGAVGKRSTLYQFCRAYQLPLPSDDEERISFIKSNKLENVIPMVQQSLAATVALYEHWREHFTPVSREEFNYQD